MEKLNENHIYIVLNKMVGKTVPVGDSAIDIERLKNMKMFIKIFDMMHTHIDDISWGYKDDDRSSVKKIVKECDGVLNKLEIE